MIKGSGWVVRKIRRFRIRRRFSRRI